jgi:hypothetical protein
VLLFPSLAILYFTGFLKWYRLKSTAFSCVYYDFRNCRHGIANIVFFKLYRCLHLFCNFSDDSGSGFSGDCWIMKCWLRCSL